jgi:endonuclease YncB( thermonuclease family)
VSDRGSRLTAAIALASLLAATGCDEATEAPRTTSSGLGTVASVTDGDTLRLRDGRRVRLVQIDAPEESADCYGREATAELARLAPPGTVVSLEQDAHLDAVDDYGRLLRYVLVAGVDVNLELVRRGAAVPYFFRGDRGIHWKELLVAVADARAARRGLWGVCPRSRLDPGRGSLTGRR